MRVNVNYVIDYIESFLLIRRDISFASMTESLTLVQDAHMVRVVNSLFYRYYTLPVGMLNGTFPNSY
jgi:hypothetical protein